mmetsp:Transcript_103924/g.233333  ORF Transcript_103924/g.233333 Transcript_103924/m.233333 type:complete len:454 (+) Transcript_103924:324-1685(+)
MGPRRRLLEGRQGGDHQRHHQDGHRPPEDARGGHQRALPDIQVRPLALHQEHGGVREEGPDDVHLLPGVQGQGAQRVEVPGAERVQARVGVPEAGRRVLLQLRQHEQRQVRHCRRRLRVGEQGERLLRELLRRLVLDQAGSLGGHAQGLPGLQAPRRKPARLEHGLPGMEGELPLPQLHRQARGCEPHGVAEEHGALPGVLREARGQRAASPASREQHHDGSELCWVPRLVGRDKGLPDALANGRLVEAAHLPARGEDLRDEEADPQDVHKDERGPLRRTALHAPGRGALREGCAGGGARRAAALQRGLRDAGRDEVLLGDARGQDRRQVVLQGHVRMVAPGILLQDRDQARHCRNCGDQAGPGPSQVGERLRKRCSHCRRCRRADRGRGLRQEHAWHFGHGRQRAGFDRQVDRWRLAVHVGQPVLQPRRVAERLLDEVGGLRRRGERELRRA